MTAKLVRFNPLSALCRNNLYSYNICITKLWCFLSSSDSTEGSPFWDQAKLSEAEAKKNARLGKRTTAVHGSPTMTVGFPSRPDENSQNAGNADERSNRNQHSNMPTPAPLSMSGSTSFASMEPSQPQQEPGHSQNDVEKLQLTALSPCITAMPPHLNRFLNAPPPTASLSMPSLNPSPYTIPTPTYQSTQQESQSMLDGAEQDNPLQQQRQPGSLQNTLNAEQQLMVLPSPAAQSPLHMAFSNTSLIPALSPMSNSQSSAFTRVLQESSRNLAVPDLRAYDSAAHSHRESSPSQVSHMFPQTQLGGMPPDSYEDDVLDQNTPPNEPLQHQLQYPRSASSSKVRRFRTAIKPRMHSGMGAGSLGSASGSSSMSSSQELNNEYPGDQSDSDSTPRTKQFRESFYRVC